MYKEKQFLTHKHVRRDKYLHAYKLQIHVPVNKGFFSSFWFGCVTFNVRYFLYIFYLLTKKHVLIIKKNYDYFLIIIYFGIKEQHASIEFNDYNTTIHM